VIVLAGSADRAVPAEVQRELSAWIQNSRFQVVSEAGHNVAAERPNELVEAVRSLSRHRQPVAA
jgi:3-oxoadipate enol-lactonase